MWRKIARNLDAVAPPGIIIDVGAGEGELAQALCRLGRRCVSLDPYSRCERVRRQYLRDVDFGDDIACLVYWHSFEHVTDPSGEAATIATLLTNGGVVVLALPNPCSIQAELLGGGWFGLDNGRHLHIISLPGLVALLDAVGFEVERRAWRGGDGGQSFVGWLDALLRLAGWRSGTLRLVLANSEVRPFRRSLGLLMAACLVPAAAGLAVLEMMIGTPGTTVLVARRSTSRSISSPDLRPLSAASRDRTLA